MQRVDKNFVTNFNLIFDQIYRQRRGGVCQNGEEFFLYKYPFPLFVNKTFFLLLHLDSSFMG